MKCPKCNTLNDENSKFCKECGTKLEHNQKDVCPVCSAPISNEKYCPQCGVKIDVSGVDKNETRKQRADRVVNLIFNIFTLIVLGLSTLLVWLPVVTMTNNDVVNNNFGNVFYTLFTQWKDLNFTGLSGVDIAINLIVTIVPFIVILSNVVVTYIFAIKGIVRTSKNLLDKKPQVYVTPILVILIVNIISVSLLSSFGLNGSLMTTVNTLPGLGSGSIIAFTFILIFGLSVYRIFNSFNKDMVSLFVEKIIFAISCMFGLLLLGNVGISFYGIDATANNSSMAYGTFYVFLERLSMINTPNLGPTYYVGFVSIAAALLVDIIVLLTVSAFVYFMYIALFSSNEVSFKLKKPILVGAIITTALMTLSFVLSTIYILSISELYDLDTSLLSNGEGLTNTFTLSIFMLGAAIAGFIISKKYMTAVKNDEIEIKG